jgi:hypothetical protein
VLVYKGIHVQRYNSSCRLTQCKFKHCTIMQSDICHFFLFYASRKRLKVRWVRALLLHNSVFNTMTGSFQNNFR